MLNPILLVVAVCFTVATLAYLFYWNRVVAFILGLAFRVANWNKGASSVWVEIGAVHFSVLAGRILLKNVRYHSANQTVQIVKAQITWRYWIRRPAEADDLAHGNGPDAAHQCRIHISVQGFEWFLYNRTAAYESIIQQMQQARARHAGSAEAMSQHKEARYPPSFLLPENLHTPHWARRAVQWVKRQLPTLDPKDLLPLGIEVVKGAIICGNLSTPELLVSEFQRADGTFGIVQSRSPHDLYKQVFDFKFQSAVIRYSENQDYFDPMLKTGEILQEHTAKTKYDELEKLTFHRFSKLWRTFKLYAILPRKRARNVAERARRKGYGKAPKSVDDDTPIGAGCGAIEYAKERKILETPVLELSYYADVVGDVPQGNHERMRSGGGGEDPLDIGNGGSPPEWGIDLVIHSGFVRYGPWADRQRAELQRAFFPTTFHEVEPTARLMPGDKRMWTSMKVFVELRDNTILHLPFREASKNWQWDGLSDVPNRPRRREPATIHLTTGDSSSISYIIPMVASETGYESRLEVHLDDLTATSSLNDIRLLSAESCRVRGELPSPRRWNAERTWTIAVSLRQPVIYLLRDHVNMFTDLAKDWTAGPPSDYHRFVPMRYVFELELHHYEMNLYTNDQNIIDKPLTREENALFTIQGRGMRTEALIPSNTYRPESTSVAFSVHVPEVTAFLALPKWNTHSIRTSMHQGKMGSRIAFVGLVAIDGSYRYYSEVREDNVEQLKLDIQAKNLIYNALGWTIRQFMVMRDNYLGSFTHFSTLYEYLDKRDHGLPIGDPVVSKYRPGSSNILQCELSLELDNGLAIMPAGLPGYEVRSIDGKEGGEDDLRMGACVVMMMPVISVHFRLHDYYMELAVSIDPVACSFEEDFTEVGFFDRRAPYKGKEAVLLDGLSITANRLFGPQPRTSTYLCIWEIQVGGVRGALTAAQAKIFMAAGTTFRMGFSDVLNAPADEFAVPVDPDITFLKLSVDSVHVVWLAETATAELSLKQGLSLESNDIPGAFHRKVTNIRVPQVAVKLLLLNRNLWSEVMHIKADACLDIYAAPRGWKEAARVQSEFVAQEDRLTDRAKHILNEFKGHNSTTARSTHKNGLFLPQPRLVNLAMQQPIYRPPQRTLKFSDRPSRPKAFRKYSSRLDTHQESDEDETGVSEADRDARLASTRRTSPLAREEPLDMDDSIASGDESDNEDLTDSESSDSDWDATERIDEPLRSDLSRYRRWTRNYTAHSLKDPSWWGTSPFVMTSEGRSFARPERKRRKKRQPSSLDEAATTLVDGVIPNDNFDVTFFRVRSREPIEVDVVPPVVLAVSALEKDLEKSVQSLDLSVDKMIADHLSETRAAGKPDAQTILDVKLAALHLRLFQRLSAYEEEGVFFLRRKGASDRPHRTLDSSIQFSSSEWSIEGDIQPLSINVSAACGQATLAVDDLGDKTRGQSDTADRRWPVELSIVGLQGAVSHGKVGFTTNSVAVHVCPTGPENVAIATLGVYRRARDVVRVHKQWMMHSRDAVQKVVLQILQGSLNKQIIDPLAAIQPSYLVQSGRPHALRIDSTFKFLTHLRVSLLHIADHTLRQSTVDRGLLQRLLDARLLVLALDTDGSTSNNAVTADLMDFKSSKSTKSVSEVKATPQLASMNIQRFSIVIYDVSSSPPCEFVLSPISITARARPMDLLQSPLANLKSFSQTSLRETGPKQLQRVTSSLSLGQVTLNVLPHLMHFAQQCFFIRRHYTARRGKRRMTDPGKRRTPRARGPIYGDFTLSIARLRFGAAAQNIVFELGSTGFLACSTLFLQSVPVGHEQSMNGNILFQDVYVRARRSTAHGIKESEANILASLIFSGGKFSAVHRDDSQSGKTLRTVGSLQGIHLNVPRSAIRLYRFVDEWRADFLPGMEATLRALLTEVKKAPLKASSPIPARSTPKRSLSVHVHGSVESLGVTLQVMHGTWLTWEIYRLILHLEPSMVSRKASQSFGVQLGSQTFSVTSRSTDIRETSSSTRLKLVLPTLSVTGHVNGARVDALACVEFFRFTVKPSHWDTLLAVQQKFGQDFNDLLLLMEQTRRKGETPLSNRSSHNSRLTYCVHLKMKGFRVGLEAASSVVFLDCEDIGGGIDNESGIVSNISLSNLALSLASRVNVASRDAFSRNHRSAFVIIDFQVKTGDDELGGRDKLLDVKVTKIHAVMQPSSIGEVGDFVDHLQSEMLERQEQRALQLQAFKEKTRSVMKTFEIKVRDEPLDEPPWLSHYTINLVVRDIGVAFPLTADGDLEVPRGRSADSSAVRAFLLSIKSIAFGTHRGETGQARMDKFSFQFVPSFRQSSPADFSGENHHTRNRLVYPEMTAQARSENTATSRQIRVGANVSGFILELDSSIPDYVFSLIDVYRRGTERMARLAASIPRTATPNAESGPQLEIKHSEVQSSSGPATNIFASMTFFSGNVRLYSGSASRLSRSTTLSRHVHEPTDDQVLEFGAEIFKLPVVSVWTEYRAGSVNGASQPRDPAILMFKATVHSSENTLRPSLLPFVTEIVHHVETRIRTISSRSPPVRPTLTLQPSTSSVSNAQDKVPATVSSLRISFSLRIDQSKLELTCQPDVNVVAGLHWDSGGFVINVEPGARKLTFTGSVGGLSVGLKHGFLSEDCVNVDARNLSFSTSFSKDPLVDGGSVSSISLVVDTEFAGGVRFSRLQDVLCFKAVWLDRIPVFNGPKATSPTPARSPAIAPFNEPAVKPEFMTVLLIRIRQIRLEVDLGTSISTVTMDLQNTLVRTKLSEALYNVSLSVETVGLSAQGNISGVATVPDCVFQTTRRLEGNPIEGSGTSKMLEMSLTSGVLELQLESDHQKLLQYRAEPLDIEVYDDWSKMKPHAHGGERPLRLAFTVTGSEITAVATVGTIPKLLAYSRKFRDSLDAQREGAARESESFRVTRTPKPDNPLSEVANAMINSARDRFMESEHGFSYVIRQYMSLRLDLLRLVVFPRTMMDPELAQFTGRAVHAQLDRLVDSDGVPGRRDLHLAFTSMTISKFSQLHDFRLLTETDLNMRLAHLLKDATEANIVGLPSMDMRMGSEEAVEDARRTLVYDFDSKFIRGADGQRNVEDIYITLNMSLYAWLTVLKKNLTREMDQAAAAPDRRVSVVPTGAAAQRKKVPEPLSIQASLSDAPLLSIPQSSTPGSAPNSALAAPGMGQSKSLSSAYPPTLLRGATVVGAPGALDTSVSPTIPSTHSPLPTPGLSGMPFPSTAADPAASPTAKPDSAPHPASTGTGTGTGTGLVYKPRHRRIERLTMRQLGEATPDVMHPFFMKKAGFNLEDSLPQYVHEYALVPLEEIMEALLKLYSRQLLKNELDIRQEG